MTKKHVVIFGGGLSALSAGIHVLQEGGAVKYDVTLLCMEHRLGGKAASWRLPDGRVMEVGFHAVFGYYRAIQKLLARAGHPVTDDRWFTDNGGVHLMYEAGPRAVNRLDIPSGPLDVGALLHNGFIGYEGMTLHEKLQAAAWMARVGAELLLTDIPPDIDEHSFTSWCVGKGLAVELTRKSWFRYVLDLAFNYPNTGSAYVGMVGFQRLMGPENSLVYYLNGGLSDVIVAPIAELFHDLGGKVRFCTKVTRVELDPATKRVTTFATRPMATPSPLAAGVWDHVEVTPLGGSYSLAESPYPVGDPAAAAGAAETAWAHGADFDEVVWTLPIDSTRALLRSTPGFRESVLEEPQLRRIWGLRTVASTSLRMWLPDKAMPAGYSTVVMGTPQPAATLIDYANRITSLANGPWGSVIELEGQEGRHGELTDDEIVRESLVTFRSLPFVTGAAIDVDAIMAQAGNRRLEFRRNTAHHMRYVLMEAGHWRHRPEQDRSPYDNLLFAGDWVSGTQPTASMEAAVRTGRVAADMLRDRAGLPAAVE